MHRDPCLRQLFLESLLQGRELKAGTNSCWPGVLRSPGRQPRAGFGTVCPRPLLATPPPRAGPSTSLCPLVYLFFTTALSVTLSVPLSLSGL